MRSTFKNINRGFIKSLKKITDNPYKNLGISWMDLRLLKNKPKQNIYKQKLLHGWIEFNNAAEFLYGVNEIFIQQTYSFNTNRKQPVIIDCGGHIGLSAIYFKTQHPDAYITVFEPDQKNFELLKSNIASQGYSNIVLENKAIWKNNATLSFNSDASMSSKIAPNEHATNFVETTRLKDLLIGEIDFLKLDIEGAEYEVIKDAKDQLFHVKNMFIEYHGLFSQQHELLEILTWIKENGFICYIKEAHNVYPQPFNRTINDRSHYDVQLNIFCFKID